MSIYALFVCGLLDILYIYISLLSTFVLQASTLHTDSVINFFRDYILHLSLKRL